MLTRIIINTSDKYLAINFMFLYSPIPSSTHFTYLAVAACFAPASDLAQPLVFKIPISVVLGKGSGALEFPILNASCHSQDSFSLRIWFFQLSSLPVFNSTEIQSVHGNDP